jgi:hypothetical protein
MTLETQHSEPSSHNLRIFEEIVDAVSIPPTPVRRCDRARVPVGDPPAVTVSCFLPTIESAGRPTIRRTTMRVMVMVKATADSEAGVMPSEKLLADMGRFNEELVRAGVMLAGEGLQASSKGARVQFSGSQRTVLDGPFAETKELVAGFWLWQVKSMAEAIEWVKRCPNPFEGESEIEIRQVFETEDFGAEFTPELREREEQMRAQLAEKR